jgi:hypothetical protein
MAAVAPVRLHDLLTIDQLAARYQLDRRTLQNWRWRGDGPRASRSAAT